MSKKPNKFHVVTLGNGFRLLPHIYMYTLNCSQGSPKVFKHTIGQDQHDISIQRCTHMYTKQEYKVWLRDQTPCDRSLAPQVQRHMQIAFTNMHAIAGRSTKHFGSRLLLSSAMLWLAECLRRPRMALSL